MRDGIKGAAIRDAQAEDARPAIRKANGKIGRGSEAGNVRVLRGVYRQIESAIIVCSTNVSEVEQIRQRGVELGDEGIPIHLPFLKVVGVRIGGIHKPRGESLSCQINGSRVCIHLHSKSSLIARSTEI